MVRLQDGLTETVCKVEGANGGGTWGADGAILFSRGIDDGLYRVPAKANGAPSAVLKVNPAKGENGYMWPQFLPDGNHFLFFIQTEAAETTGVYTGRSIRLRTACFSRPRPTRRTPPAARPKRRRTAMSCSSATANSWPRVSIRPACPPWASP